MPKIKIIRVPGKSLFIEIDNDASLKNILDSAGITINFNDEALFIGNTKVEKTDVNKIIAINSDIIIAKGAKGHAPTPKIKKAIKHIVSLGYAENGGKGDHKKYTDKDGNVIVLNTDKNDNKHLDLGSSKSLAKALGLNLTTLYAALN